MPPEQSDRIAASLANEEPFGVRVPVRVAAADGQGPEAWSHLDVVMQTNDGRARPANFYREGIRVPDAGAKIRLQGVDALALVDDRPLATMLGLAEGPAHMDWVSGTDRVKGVYADGKRWISFVKSAPKEILRLVRSVSDDEDSEIAADFFSLPSEPASRRAKVPRRSKTGQGPDTGAGPKRPRYTRVDKVPGGFSVSATECSPGDTVAITFAYDVRRGSAFKKWRPFDFDLESEAISVITNGASQVMKRNNTIDIIVDETGECRCLVTGFDPNRDLEVRARRTPS
jgi:hypothetical protein